MKNTLFIVDDHKMLQNGLKSWLEDNSAWKITGLFTRADDCLNTLENIHKDMFPEIIIIDIQLSGENGLKLLHQITEKYPEIKSVMYSMYDTAGYILQAKNLGAKGYISKIASEKELLKCLLIVSNDGIYMEPRFEELQEKLKPITSVLSNQELLIFEKMLQNKTNNEIKDELCISLPSVQNYVSFIYTLSSVHNRADFIAKFSEKK